MQLTHIRRADLNLLPALAVLLEERQVSKAAERFHLSQPAMSRVLQRLRETFADELLVRGQQGFELTSRARRLQDELQVLLPQLDRLLRGDAFDPATAEERFRLCCPDFTSLMVVPAITKLLARYSRFSSVEIIAAHDGAFADIMHGKLDVLIWSNDVPAPFISVPFLDDELVCVMSPDHPATAHLTLERYLAHRHVLVTVAGSGTRGLIDRQLAAMGHQRKIGLRVPYFSAAVLAVEGTGLIATVPRQAAQAYLGNANIAIVKPPLRLEPLRYLLAWHPRVDADPAQQWFRSMLAGIAAATKAGALPQSMIA